MSAIGHKTTGWKYRVGLLFFIEITRHELHPTKGWRAIGRMRRRVREGDWKNYPAREVTFERTRPRRERPAFEPSPEWLERARMRHKWYRKQKEIEAWRATLPAANRLDIAEVA